MVPHKKLSSGRSSKRSSKGPVRGPIRGLERSNKRPSKRPDKGSSKRSSKVNSIETDKNNKKQKSQQVRKKCQSRRPRKKAIVKTRERAQMVCHIHESLNKYTHKRGPIGTRSKPSPRRPNPIRCHGGSSGDPDYLRAHNSGYSNLELLGGDVPEL